MSCDLNKSQGELQEKITATKGKWQFGVGSKMRFGLILDVLCDVYFRSNVFCGLLHICCMRCMSQQKCEEFKCSGASFIASVPRLLLQSLVYRWSDGLNPPLR